MPIEYEIHSEDGLLISRSFGDIEVRDILEALDQIEADPAYVPGMDEVMDLSQATSFNLEDDVLQGIADLKRGLYARLDFPVRSSFWVPTRQAKDLAQRYKAAFKGAHQFIIFVSDDLEVVLEHMDPGRVKNLARHFTNANCAGDPQEN